MQISRRQEPRSEGEFLMTTGNVGGCNKKGANHVDEHHKHERGSDADVVCHERS